MTLDREPGDPLAPFVGARNVLLLYLVVATVLLFGRWVNSQEVKENTMQNGVQYSRPDRTGPQANQYHGATSHGDGWEIRWAGPYNPGPKPIEVLKATLDHLTHLQRTSDAASEANAKLLFHVHKAIEEHDGKPPTMGGELNNLIPKSEDSSK